MIRRSTLVFLTCLAALSVPAIQAKSAASPAVTQGPASQLLLAQLSNAEKPAGLANKSLGLYDTGEAVKALQIRLQEMGYYEGSIDSLFGLDTQRAVVAFQADKGLKQSGTLTNETWDRLEEAGAPQSSSPSEPSTLSNDVSNTAGGSTASGIEASAQTTTAPTNSELPSLSTDGDSDAIDAEVSTGGGLGKVFGLSIGLVALLSSFGVGFYMANRSKSEAEMSEEGGWGNVMGGSQLPPGTSQGALSSASQGGLAPSFSAVSNTSNSGGGIQLSNSSANGANAAITAATSSALQTGQMGGTAPLAPVDIIDGLIGDLRNPDPTQRRKAIWELGQRGNSLAMQPLVDSMVNADSKEKSLVLAALSEIGIRSLKPMSRALSIALQDDNPDVRKNAIRDLTRVYELVVQISQMLGHATEDEDPEVRQTATWALDQLNRIRRSQDIDSTVRSFTGGGSAKPIDLLSSEASLRRNSQ